MEGRQVASKSGLSQLLLKCFTFIIVKIVTKCSHNPRSFKEHRRALANEKTWTLHFFYCIVNSARGMKKLRENKRGQERQNKPVSFAPSFQGS